MLEKNVVPVILLLTFGIAAVVLLSPDQNAELRPTATQPEEEHSSPEVDSEEIPVMVVAVDVIKPYVPFTEEMVTLQQMRRADVPPDAVQSFEELDRRALRRPAHRGEVLLRSNVGERAEYNIGTEIPLGVRVATGKIEGKTTDLGTIQPQDRVDVYCVYQAADADGNQQTKTKKILSEIEVFGVGVDRYKPEARSRNISLLVSPKQASILMLANHKGYVTVVKTKAGE